MLNTSFYEPDECFIFKPAARTNILNQKKGGPPLGFRRVNNTESRPDSKFFKGELGNPSKRYSSRGRMGAGRGRPP